MPGLQRNDQLCNGSSSYYSLSINNNGSVCSSNNGFWSKHSDDINSNRLQKFWSDLPQQARQKLVRIEKQTLFEQARKNMYCSRCNGLLLEGFAQIVMYGKSLQHEGAGGRLPCSRVGGTSKDQMNGGMCTPPVCQDETQDPSVHPWGGLTTTRDGALTLLDCYLCSTSLKGLQNVFDSARARERERELLYPDACGGGGRGWISQGIASYGRGHGTRETCALHTARLSCDTLVDFWTALGEETRHSLLKMKEEDFIERLMYRFDSKRFCRDCRRNVIREFKELKELKRMRREPRCTDWFCVADTAFQYEVSNDTIHADWHQTFIDSYGSYHHFEWAVGSGEGKSDILDFKNVGMSPSVEASGLDLDGLTACYITLRAWKLDGRCSEFSVKAHALKKRQCVHCRLVVGDGYVTIMPGEDIQEFFEHAEEAEEEEDDESMDKDGSDLDGECSRPQKHAKSPELAREFLLDAATVIFKEQVEKAFREGTARQNAHSIFVCLALKLLEERIHVACKEITTLEKQMKLLEEEEKEKREEEERREKKRNKERERKLRRKERLRGKDKDKQSTRSSQNLIPSEVSDETVSACIDDETINGVRDSVSENGDTNVSESASPGFLDESSSNDYTASDYLNNTLNGADEELDNVKEGNGTYNSDNVNGSQWRYKARRDFPLESSVDWSDRLRRSDNGAVAYKSESRYYDDPAENKVVNFYSRQPRATAVKFSAKNSGPRFSHKAQCSSVRMTGDRSDLHSCGCNQQTDYMAKTEPHMSGTRPNRETRCITKTESTSDVHKPVHRINKFNQTDFTRDNFGKIRIKISNYSSASARDSPHTKKVWEPVEPQKRYPRSNSDSDVTLRMRSCSFKTENDESDKCTPEVCPSETGENFATNSQVDDSRGNCRVQKNSPNGFETEATYHPKETAEAENDSCLTANSNHNDVTDFPVSSSSSSDNCSSCQSEGDTNTPSSNHQNLESSSITDSEDSCEQSEGRDSTEGKGISACVNGSLDGHDVVKEKSEKAVGQEDTPSTQSSFLSQFARNHFPWHCPAKASTHTLDNGSVASIPQGLVPSVHNPGISFPVFQGPSTVGYYHQNSVPWSTASANGLIAYPHVNPYLLTSSMGYGLNGDSNFCMNYGQMQHLASPFISSHSIPVYQPIHTASMLKPQEQTIPLEVNGVRDLGCESRRENVVTRHHSTGGSDQPSIPKSDTKNAGFSLFQFGGPVALPTRKSSEQSLDEKKTGELSSCHVEGEQKAWSKKGNTIEEYNLFAARTGIEFSIH
ncbi:unnamed protein product [Amaranthus hypochondriacus]